jgi:hypothetical protein
MYVAFPSTASLDSLDISELLDVALRVHLHHLKVPFQLRIQCPARLEDTVEHYKSVAELERDQLSQASHGAVWGARQVRDDFVVAVACEQHNGGSQVSYQRLCHLLDHTLSATSQVYLGFMLTPQDKRTGIPLNRYLPAPMGGPEVFWIGATWGMSKYHTLAKLAMEARRNGCDILESWLEFQLAT